MNSQNLRTGKRLKRNWRIKMFEDAWKGITAMVIGFFVTVPFAVWKWVEIIIWVVKHVNVSFEG